MAKKHKLITSSTLNVETELLPAKTVTKQDYLKLGGVRLREIADGPYIVNLP